jgi:hypothetical protein
MSVKLSTRSGLEWEAPVSLFKIPDSNNSGEYSYDVSNDAKRFLLNVPSDPNTRVPAMIVVNWLAEIKPLKEE